MDMRSAHPTGAQASAAQPRTLTAVGADSEQGASLTRSALAFAVFCHAGRRRGSDGAPFIEHSLEVARLLRDAGCSEVVVAAGLLHDVVEDADVSVAELTARFGADVASLVRAVTDDESHSYRERMQVLREQVRCAGTDAALLFAADKISEVRELPGLARRDRARMQATARGSRARNHLEHYQRMRLEHYQECLGMLELVAPRHPLVSLLANDLARCAIPGPDGR